MTCHFNIKNLFSYLKGLYFVIIIFQIFSTTLSSKDKIKIYYESNISETKTEQLTDQLYHSRNNAITKAVEMCNPAIVGINVTETIQVEYKDPFFDFFYDDPLFKRFFGTPNRQPMTREYKVQGLGSGFLISPDGYIVTNHHVAGNASKILVTMKGGVKYDAEIIGSDLTSDVALLKIKGENFPFLKLANSDEVITGEWAIAFGNPFGLFDLNAKPTVTVGVVSNIGINLFQDNRVYKNLIQTDAAISSGNSGGPLVNANGEVIGVNTMIFSTAQSNRGAGSIGIGWAIPINRVKKIIDILYSEKKIDRDFYLGMEVKEIDEKIAKYIGKDIKDGVVVFAVERGTSADEAGIEPGDIILEIDGNAINKISDYYITIFDGVVGQKLKFSLLRDNNIIERTLELKKRKKK